MKRTTNFPCFSVQLVIMLLLVSFVDSFFIISHKDFKCHHLFYRKAQTNDDDIRISNFPSPGSRTSSERNTHVNTPRTTTATETLEKRSKLRQELIQKAIEDYDIADYNPEKKNTTVAEDVMKELELVCPISLPAESSLLNARWSFVFTGFPTIGMQLIRLLSRMAEESSGMIDFGNVFLEVAQRQSQVKAIVRFCIMGQALELNVFTKLRRPSQDDKRIEDRTLILESFDKVVFQGIEIPTPDSWKSTRDLRITYLDNDIMIARTNGGEPHLLLRHSSCSTDDEACGSTEETSLFEDARSKYGEQVSRSLVDRAYSQNNVTAKDERFDNASVASLLHEIVTSSTSQ